MKVESSEREKKIERDSIGEKERDRKMDGQLKDIGYKDKFQIPSSK